jgi:tyrosyl-tRNA synthetase
MFTQIMAVSDRLMWNYFELLTDAPQTEIAELKLKTEKEIVHPRDVKMDLAHRIVAIFYDKKQADGAKEEFVRVAREGKLPTDIPVIAVKEKSLSLPELLTALAAAKSKGEARRLAEQNGVKIDGRIKNDWKETIEVKPGMVVQIGKSKFYKIA